MAKKTTRNRKSSRPRLSEAQLQAYRARQVAARPEATIDVPSESRVTRQTERRSAAVTAWGHIDEEYAMIRADLVRLVIISAICFGIILVLWFLLG